MYLFFKFEIFLTSCPRNLDKLQYKKADQGWYRNFGYLRLQKQRILL